MGIMTMQTFKDRKPKEGQVDLEMVRIGLAKVVSPALMKAKVRVEEDWLVDMIRIELTGFLLGEQIDKKEVSYPSNWKEAFKERWFPEWAKNKWPVCYTAHVMDAKALYPELHTKLSWPDKDERAIVSLSEWSYSDEN